MCLCTAGRLRRLALLLCVALLPVLVACSLGATSPTLDTTASEQDTSVAAPLAPDVPAGELFERALERRAVGDDEGAAADLVFLLQRESDARLMRLTRYYLAESYARRGRWASAVEAFKAFVADPTEDEYRVRALFWLARGYEELGARGEAIAVYRQYRAFNTVLEPYAAAREAAQQQGLGNVAEAAQGYAYVGTTDISRAERAASYEEAIALYRQLGQDAEALRLYGELLGIASKPDYRAHILFEAAALAEALGQTEQARTWLREIIAVAPANAEAVGTVQQLTAAGDPGLEAAAAARVYFTHSYYEAALPWFDAALSQVAAGSEEALELQRLRALSVRETGDFAQALDGLAAVANSSPASESGRQAHLDWIQTLGQSGDVEQAAQRYAGYAQAYADDWRAPVALDRAAQLHERLGDVERATQLRLQLGQQYPTSEVGAAALNAAGWYFFIPGG